MDLQEEEGETRFCRSDSAMSSRINTGHCKEMKKKWRRGSERKGGEYRWPKQGGFMAMVVDLMVGDEDGARRCNEETNGAVEAGGDEGVDERLQQRGAGVRQGSGQRGIYMASRVVGWGHAERLVGSAWAGTSYRGSGLGTAS